MDLTFTQPTRPVSENESRGRHWGPVRAALKPWQDMAWAVTRNAIAEKRFPGAGHTPVTVQVFLQFAQVRTRDPHNYTSTVVKACVDGIKRAGLIPEDTAEWVTVLDPILVAGMGRPPLKCTVRIEPRETVP